MNSRIGFALLGTLAFGLLAGCVDAETPMQERTRHAQKAQAVVVTPEFKLVGAEEVPEHLFLTQLGLLVSEIRLTPMASTSSGVAYSTAEPIELSFDVAEGQFVQTGKAVTLPDAGRYVVSIRLEPMVQGDQELGSLSVEGFVASETSDVSKNSDGTPLPLPFDEKPEGDGLTDAADAPLAWTPFTYNSRRTVFYTLNQVDLEEGDQYLEFSFDLRDWANGVATHISKAVKTSPATGEDGGVDVTRQIESLGQGVDAIVQTGAVTRDPTRF